MVKKLLLEFTKEELNFLYWALEFIEGGPFDAETEEQRDAAEFKVRKALSDYHEGTRSSPKGLQDDLFWYYIHPAIKKVSKSRYESEHYADAVEAAFKHINKIVKEIVKSASGEELDGAALMYRAFSPNKPIIRLGDLTTENGMNIQQGYMQIFAGAMIGIRNPRAHGNDEIEKLRANHLLTLASLLMFILAEQNQQGT